MHALFSGAMQYTVERDTNSSGPKKPGDTFRNYTLDDPADFPTTEIFGNAYGVIAAVQLAASAGTAASRLQYAVYLRNFVNSLMRDTSVHRPTKSHAFEMLRSI